MTMTLLAYNQEQHVREAVEGAFAQTYQPLEIILSDDCSQDRTAEIIRELAAGYRGPHRVTVNVNPRNLGIGAHFNRLIKLIHGEFVVTAAGDDVAFPERVEVIHREWQSGSNVTYVYTNFVRTYEGSELRTTYRPQTRFDHARAMIPACGPKVVGCSAAWHRRAFDVFGPMTDDTVCEDRVIPFRAALLGEIRYTETPTLNFRCHPGHISETIVPSERSTFEQWCRVVKRRGEIRQSILRNFQRDVATAVDKGLLAPAVAADYLHLIEVTQAHEYDKLQVEVGAFVSRLAASLRLLFSTSTPITVSRRRRLRYLTHALLPWVQRWQHARRSRALAEESAEADAIP